MGVYRVIPGEGPGSICDPSSLSAGLLVGVIGGKDWGCPTMRLKGAEVGLEGVERGLAQARYRRESSQRSEPR